MQGAGGAVVGFPPGGGTKLEGVAANANAALQESICFVYTFAMPSVARLFQNGQSQAVRLPREFRFEGDRVHVRRVGSAVVLLPWREPWQTLTESLALFSVDFAAALDDAPLEAAPDDAGPPAAERALPAGEPPHGQG